MRTDQQHELSTPRNEEGTAEKFHANEPFSEKARRLIETRKNMGCIEDADARGYFRGRCGDSMQFDLRLDGKKITQAKFMTDGCDATIACGSMLTQLVVSKTLFQAGQITSGQLLSALGGLPEEDEHCAELAVRTLKEALIDADLG